jgi:hypothetical protein
VRGVGSPTAKAAFQQSLADVVSADFSDWGRTQVKMRMTALALLPFLSMPAWADPKLPFHDIKEGCRSMVAQSAGLAPRDYDFNSEFESCLKMEASAESFLLAAWPVTEEFWKLQCLNMSSHSSSPNYFILASCISASSKVPSVSGGWNAMDHWSN